MLLLLEVYRPRAKTGVTSLMHGCVPSARKDLCSDEKKCFWRIIHLKVKGDSTELDPG